MKIGPVEVVINARGDDVFPQFLNEIGLLNNNTAINTYPSVDEIRGKHVCCLSRDIDLSLLSFAAYATVIYYSGSRDYTINDLRMRSARPATYRIEYIRSA